MTLSRVITWVGLLGLVLALTACAKKSPKTDAPPAPDMPPHWKVVFDVRIAPQQIAPIERKLGGSISSLRNTAYDVKGKRVQLNTIVARNAENADKLMAKLESMKSKDALLRRDLVIYEFVGKNDALPYIQEGREHIASRK